jgi:tetratricopeptide (TPR) repeat protein
VLRDLRGLSKDGAEFVAGHLVAAGSLADEEPELAWLHARAARARGGRIAVVRETVGLVAYRAGEWAEAIGELRAARRMGGGPGHLAVMADAERALGHPERAIELSRSAEADDLDEDAAIELVIVVAGARADLGQIDAALAHLERIGWREDAPNARIAYAYADLLLQAGRRQEALTWFVRAADADTDEETDAGERLAELSASLADTVDGAVVDGAVVDGAVVDGAAVAGAAAYLVTTDGGGPTLADAAANTDLEPDWITDSHSAPEAMAGAVRVADAGLDTDEDATTGAALEGTAVSTEHDQAPLSEQTAPGDTEADAADLDAEDTDGFETVSETVAGTEVLDQVSTNEDAASVTVNVTGDTGTGDIDTDDLDPTGDDDAGTATDDPGNAADDAGTGTDDAGTATDDGSQADAGSASDPGSPAGEPTETGPSAAPDGSVTDTDTDSTADSTTDTTPGAGDVGSSADPLSIPALLFSDDPLAGDR